MRIENLSQYELKAVVQGPLEKEEHDSVLELIRWKEEHNKRFTDEWLKAALTTEEYERTIGVDPELLKVTYPYVAQEGPNGLVFENRLLHVETYLNMTKADRKKERKRGKDFFLAFFATYGERDHDSEATKHFHSLAEKELAAIYSLLNVATITSRSRILGNFNHLWSEPDDFSEMHIGVLPIAEYNIVANFDCVVEEVFSLCDSVRHDIPSCSI
jgi:hypothetical protein